MTKARSSRSPRTTLVPHVRETSSSKYVRRQEYQTDEILSPQRTSKKVTINSKKNSSAKKKQQNPALVKKGNLKTSSFTTPAPHIMQDSTSKSHREIDESNNNNFNFFKSDIYKRLASGSLNPGQQTLGSNISSRNSKSNNYMYT